MKLYGQSTLFLLLKAMPDCIGYELVDYESTGDGCFNAQMNLIGFDREIYIVINIAP